MAGLPVRQLAPATLAVVEHLERGISNLTGAANALGFQMPMPNEPTDQGGARALRPFDPERPKTGLFTFTRDPGEAPPIETFRDVLAIRNAAGLSGDELREFWVEAWHREQFNLDTLFPFIVRVAWRLTRALAIVKGRLPLDSFLNEMNQEEWTVPSRGLTAGSTHSLERALTIHEIALTPPEVPVEWTDGSKDANFYDAAGDPKLCEFVDRIGALSRRLGIGMRKEGRLGLAPLLEVDMTRAAWPTPREIMAFEAVMADEASQALLAHGHLGARRELQKLHGFNEEEVNSMLLLARRVMRGIRNGADADGDKALMVARLEDLAARCRQNLDLRAELMVYKTLSVVQGLTKDRGEDGDVDDMVDVAAEIAKDEDTPLLEEGDEGDEE